MPRRLSFNSPILDLFQFFIRLKYPTILVMPYTSLDSHSGHWVISSPCIRLHTLQIVNSGEMVNWAACVLSNVFLTRFSMLAAGGLSSPTKAWIMAPDSIIVWNLL